MTDLNESENRSVVFVNIVADQVEAAVSYFRLINEALHKLVPELTAAAKESTRLGRDLAKIEMTSSSLKEEIGYQRIDLSSSAGKAVIVVNQNVAGELFIDILYHDSRTKPITIIWKFPRKNAIAADQVADYIVRSLIAPTDFVMK